MRTLGPCMGEFLQTAFTLAPVILGLVAGAVAWRRVTRPLLYLVVSSLALVGIQTALSPVVVLLFLVSRSGTPEAIVHGSYLRGLAAAACGVAVLGLPLLFWLYQIGRA